MAARVLVPRGAHWVQRRGRLRSLGRARSAWPRGPGVALVWAWNRPSPEKSQLPRPFGQVAALKRVEVFGVRVLGGAAWRAVGHGSKSAGRNSKTELGA